jgi:hypothetical protein
MSTEQAAAYYLETVCAANKTIDKLNDAFDAQNFKKIVRAAKKARKADQAAASRLDDPMLIWPDAVADDVETVFNSYFSSLTYDNGVAEADNLAEANAVSFDDVEGGAEASQRVRLRLGLPADTNEGC